MYIFLIVHVTKRPCRYFLTYVTADKNANIGFSLLKLQVQARNGDFKKASQHVNCQASNLTEGNSDYVK